MASAAAAKKSNVLLDAIVLSQSYNVHTALQHLIEFKKIAECSKEDGKICYANQQMLKQLEENFVDECYRFFNIINIKRPLETYYGFKLLSQRRWPDL